MLTKIIDDFYIDIREITFFEIVREENEFIFQMKGSSEFNRCQDIKLAELIALKLDEYEIEINKRSAEHEAILSARVPLK